MADFRISGSSTTSRSECDIRINYNDLQKIIAASNDIGSSPQAQFSSTDGGATWNQSSLPILSSDDNHTDPMVDWTSDGTAWAMTLGVNASTVNKVRLYKSTDSGSTWTFDSTVSGTQTGCDREIMWVDHSPTSSFQDQIYATWHTGTPVFFNRRTTGTGAAWQTPVQLSGSETTGMGIGGDVKTNANGDVFVFWQDADGSQKIYMVKSTDGGATFGSVATITSIFANTRKLSIPADSSRKSRVYVSAGAYRTATDDLVYLVWADLSGESGCTTGGGPGTSAASSCKTRVWFARSTDGGSTWSSPAMLNNQSGKNDQAFPRLAVDETDGTLVVIYYDTVADPNRLKTDLYVQTSNDFGSTWSNATKITTGQTDETTSSADSGNQYGDYTGLTGHAGIFYPAWTDRRSGGKEEIWSAKLLPAAPALQLIINKGTFGQDEVAAQASWPAAYWLQVTGFTNEALGFSAPGNLSGPPNPAPVVSVSVDDALNQSLGLTTAQIATLASNLPTVDAFGPGPILADDATLLEELQTFLYPYTISFASQDAFQALNAHQVALLTLDATFTVGSATVNATALLELAKGEDPRFENINPADPAAFPVWLSYDLRFFTTTAGQSHNMFGVPSSTDATGAVPYIQSVLHNLNTPGTSTGGDTFDSLTQNEELSALEFIPADDNGNLVFNFALARVRVLSSIATTIDPVRVFFRLFSAQSTHTNFDESTTYRWGTDGSANHKIPLLGVQADQHGNLEWVTIPCFASERVNWDSASGTNTPADMKTQHDDPNAQSITTVPGTEVDTYYGCWLDINQPDRTFLAAAPPSSAAQWDGPWPGTDSVNSVIIQAPHQCLIAEIRFDDTPVPPGATAAITDKLAQRNIAWIDGPNPGADPSRVMPHPFEIRATLPAAGKVDELLIDWGQVPPGTSAAVYLPEVDAAEVIALADRMYLAHRLSAGPAHVIRCEAGSGTLIPVPRGAGRYAGLIEVDLPSGIRKGDSFDIVIRQIHDRTVFVPRTPPPRSGRRRADAASAEGFGRRTPLTWREVLGTFQLTIPVSTRERLLLPEERLLAWLKWKISVLPATRRWHPVLVRYAELVAGRVRGFGGDPGKIPPSPVGHVPGVPHRPPHERGERRYVGKVVALRYDRFGDFAGFTLRTVEGHERSFRAEEPKLQELLSQAWVERALIEVIVADKQPEWPASISLLRL
jgi:Glycosyl hydrolases family 32 N-terminal domain